MLFKVTTGTAFAALLLAGPALGASGDATHDLMVRSLPSKAAVSASQRSGQVVAQRGTKWFRTNGHSFRLMPPARPPTIDTPERDPVAKNAVAKYVDDWVGHWRESFPFPQELARDVDNRSTQPDVFDQGERGTCWANAIASSVANFIKRNYGTTFVPSRAQLVAYSQLTKKADCLLAHEGANVDSTLTFLGTTAENGALCGESDLPYNGAMEACAGEPHFSMECAHAPNRWWIKSHKTFRTHPKGQVRNDARNVRLIETLLSRKTDVVLTFAFVGDWGWLGKARSGVIDVEFKDGKPEAEESTHAVTIVGYHHADSFSDSYFIIKNSWSSAWGRGGYARVSYDFVSLYAREISIIMDVQKA